MELVTVKILVLTLSGFVRLFFGMLPLVVVKTLVTKWSKATDKRMKKVISVLMFFGGGVLLATCFLHMMPEVRDNFKTAEPDLELPLSEIIFLAGFFLVYMIEDVVHSIVHKRRSNKEARNNANLANGMQLHSGGGKGNLNLSSGTSSALVIGNNKGLHNNDEAIINSPANGDIAINNKATNPILSLSLSTPNQSRETKEIFRKNSTSEQIPGLPKGTGIVNAAYVSEKFQYCDPDWLKDCTANNGNGSQMNSLACGKTSASDCYDQTCSNSNANNYPTVINEIGNDETFINNNNNKTTTNTTTSNGFLQVPQFFRRRSSNRSSNRSVSSNRSSKSSHSHMHLPTMDDNVDDSIGGEIRNILIVIAISFHGIFEGMAIGLQSSESDVWYLFLAVSLHECTILFCIDIELISSKTKVFRMILYILVVSLVSPVGIAIGIIITEKAYGGVIHQALIIGLFQGLAAGTLLYVTFFEIFQEEGKKLHRKCYHILVAVFGFILMGSLEFMGGHEHGGHSHGNDGTSSALNKTILDNHDGHNHSHDHSHDHDHPH